jgi:hypothetical protein
MIPIPPHLCTIRAITNGLSHSSSLPEDDSLYGCEVWEHLSISWARPIPYFHSSADADTKGHHASTSHATADSRATDEEGP